MSPLPYPIETPRRLGLASALLFLLAFGVYLYGLSPAWHPDDSGETITAGATLSIQHPPGYPLHSLLGRVATLCAPGGIPFRINLIAAFFGALAVLLFAWALAQLLASVLERDLDESLWGAGAVGALVFGASYTLWFQAGIAKGGIYTLNMALTLATLIALLRLRQLLTAGVSPTDLAARRALSFAALFYGLGWANHWTSQIVLLPGFVLLFVPYIIPRWRELRWPQATLLILPILFFACGLSLYIYLPLRSLLGPPMQWGEPWRWEQFLWVFTRGQYAGIEASKSWEAWMALGRRMALDAASEYSLLGLGISALGWCLLALKRPWLGTALFALPFSLLAAVLWKANPPADALWIIDPYLIPAWAGIGLGWSGLALLPGRWRAHAWQLGLVSALALGVWHARDCTRRDDYLAYDYTRHLFLTAPKNAILFCEGDSNTAGPLVWQHGLHKRLDVSTVIAVLVDYPWYQAGLARSGLKVPGRSLGPPFVMDLIQKAHPQRPALVSNHFTPTWWDPTRMLPQGLGWKLSLRPQKANPALLKRLDPWQAYVVRGAFGKDAVPQDPITVRLVTDNYVGAHDSLGQALWKLEDWAGAEAIYVRLGVLKPEWAAPWVQAGNSAYFRRDLAAAERHWRRALLEEPLSAEANANVALACLERGKSEEALAFAKRALELAPGLASAQALLERARQSLVSPGPPKGPGSSRAEQVATRADGLAMKGEDKQALSLYQEAIQLGFENAALHRNRAVLLNRQGDLKAAAAAMVRATQLEPKSSELWRYRGIFESQAGDNVAAQVSLNRALELDPNNAGAAQALLQLKTVAP